jgi:hypothetical protein
MMENCLDDSELDGDHDDKADRQQDNDPSLHVLLDAGYGVPREARPRQEKILAMAKQIANFLKWQMQHYGEPARVTVVGCPDEDMKACLLDRLKQLWQTMGTKESLLLEEDTVVALPPNFSFADSLVQSQECLRDAVYLSPDAPSALDPCRRPPRKVIVGLLIDRRVQVNRSLLRSQQLQLPVRRWPMEVLGDDQHPQEPLNVDTILEALQQWYWNYNNANDQVERTNDNPFRQASMQAFGHHAHRHPARPKHRPVS